MTARDDLVRALEVLAETVKAASAAVQAEYAPVPEPVKAEQPDRFEYMDADSDEIRVRPHEGDQYVTINGKSGVLLTPDAVNRLAQYLDQYRTDTQCPTYCPTGHEPEQCAGTRDHEGRCSPDADMIGSPEPLRHWCGRNSDHPGHEYVGVSSQQSMRCLGVSNGMYES